MPPHNSSSRDNPPTATAALTAFPCRCQLPTATAATSTRSPRPAPPSPPTGVALPSGCRDGACISFEKQHKKAKHEPTISQQVGEGRVRLWKREHEAAARRDKLHSASGEAVVASMGGERVVGKWVSQLAAMKERGERAADGILSHWWRLHWQGAALRWVSRQRQGAAQRRAAQQWRGAGG